MDHTLNYRFGMQTVTPAFLNFAHRNRFAQSSCTCDINVKLQLLFVCGTLEIRFTVPAIALPPLM
jgi:hypothetical protein